MKQSRVKFSNVISLAVPALVFVVLALSYAGWAIIRLTGPRSAPFLEINSCRGTIMVSLKRPPEGAVAAHHLMCSIRSIPANPPPDLVFQGGFDVIDKDSGFSLGVLGFHKGKGQEPVYVDLGFGNRVLAAPGIPRRTIGVIFASYWLILVLTLVPVVLVVVHKIRGNMSYAQGTTDSIMK